MANTLLTEIDLMAATALEAVQKKLIPLMAFSRDFSSEGLYKGQTAQVKQYIKSTDVAKDFTGEAGGLYTDTDAIVEQKIDVVLNKHLYKSYELTQDELQRGVDPRHIQNVAVKLVEDMLDYIMLPIVTGNYSNQTIIAAASFDSDTVSETAEAADLLDWSDENRTMILNAAYWGALTRDPAIKGFDSSNSGAALNEHGLPRLSGFDMMKYAKLPTNSDNLQGFAVHENALAVATGIVTPGSSASLVQEWTTATDPVTGLTLGFRRFTDVATGKEYFVAEVLAGRVVAEATAIHRIVTA